jgi:putative DNA primase/helicase
MTQRYSLNGRPLHEPVDLASRLDETSTDVGRARVILDLIHADGGDVVFSPALGFASWDDVDGIWRLGADDDVRAYVHRLGDLLGALATEAFADAGQETDEDRHREALARAGRIRRQARSCHSSRAADAALRELRALEPVRRIEPDDFDADPTILAVGNGYLNLADGRLLEPNRFDLVTQRLDLDFDAEATAPRWEEFLRQVLIGDDGETDDDLVAWIQRLIGYGITGSTSEQVFGVLHGVGANGKGVFLETLADVFGPLVKTSPFSAFEAKGGQSIPNDLARLAGSRLVFASEGDARTPLSAPVVKRLTGEDRITARFLNREFFEFSPRFLILLATNHRPVVQDSSEGYWRRVRLVPFRRFFAPSERDRGLRTALRAEHAGILRWAVEGAIDWHASGLGNVATVEHETDLYRTTTDRLAEFIAGHLEISGEWLDVVKATEVWNAYRSWADEAGEEHPLRRTTLLQTLGERRGITQGVRSKQAILRGVRILDVAERKRREHEGDRALRLTTPGDAEEGATG